MGSIRITVDEVKRRLDRGDRVTFLDTRNPTAWAESDRKLLGAIRIPADAVDRHLDEIPKQGLIAAYCT